MTPNPQENWRVSGISRNYPSYRKGKFVTVQGWLEGKVADDGAEGLWRIRDKLYDLSDFAARHPGGAFWITCTKGTDITEQFESHHIVANVTHLLDKFEVSTAKAERNYKFTLHENGFYMTLKRRVRDKLRDIDYKPSRKTDLVHTGLLLSMLLFSWLATLTNWFILKSLAALTLAWLCTCAHNYFHQRDNWRMYTFNFTLMNFNSWRVSHALSHHGYPNSLHDLEMSLFEPFLCWIPDIHYAGRLQRKLSVIFSPVAYAMMGFVQFFGRLAYSLQESNIMYWDDLVGFSLPLFLFYTTNVGLDAVLVTWLTILTLACTIFGFFGVTAAHHDPQIYHDGDAPNAERDWGIYQIDTIIDRSEIKWSDFMVLTQFGEHALHHLFPTLDHAVLKQLYPELQQTLLEFNTQLRETNHWGHIKGQSKQLLRTTVNLRPPGSKDS